MKRINCIHYCGYSNCAHPDKGWLIWGKGCILTGDGFASECKNKVSSQPPTVRELDGDLELSEFLKGSKLGDPFVPRGKVPDIRHIPPMPEVKPPKSGYQMNNDELTRAIASIHAITKNDPFPKKLPNGNCSPGTSHDSVIHYKTLLSIQKKRAELIVFEDNSKQAQKKG